MNNDLVAELKSRLHLAELVRAHGVELKRGSRAGDFVGCCPFHAEKTGSFNVHPDYFKCFGCGKSGDVLTWIAAVKFGTFKPDGVQFIEVLREGCQLAGIAFPEKDGEKAEGSGRRQEQQRIRGILNRYLEVAESARTPEFYVRARQRKAYLTEAVCQEWRLGFSPTLAQCLEYGLSELELRDVKLLCDPQRDGPDAKPYMFFRDSIVIPYVARGAVVYFSSRYLSDTDGTGKLRERKTLHMIASEHAPRPAGFNLDAFHDPAARAAGLLLVEGPLDAVACCELGHPAVALLGSHPQEQLLKTAKAAAGLRLYLALDGTDDVDAVKRAEVAAGFGFYTNVCVLPAGRDPDELTGAELAALKADALPVLETWLELLEA